MATLFRVKALYEYVSPHDDDLGFPEGQIIAVTDEDDDDWYGGEYIDSDGVKQEGIFPRNFVEKFEPVAPPRPTRTRPKKEPEAPPPPVVEARAPSPPPPQPEEPAQSEEDEPEVEEADEPIHQAAQAERPVPTVPAPAPAPVPVPAATKHVERAPAPAPPPPAREIHETPAPAPAPKPKAAPPPVSEKPASNSFKDRIAAFNRSDGPPITPFKPGGLAGSKDFVKKPFVPAPPSRNAYVPPPREPAVVAKDYRRDEDPEIKEREAEAMRQAENAGLVPAETRRDDGDEEDQPKPTSLKERIALLQKQQIEQAQRHSEAALKKEKPKRPPKKRLEPTASAEAADNEDAEEAPLERKITEEAAPRTSTDDATARIPLPARRRSSRGPGIEAIRDGNEADMSGAGDTTEGQDDEREDSDETPRHVSRVPTAAIPITRDDREEAQDDEQAQDDEEEVEEEDDDERGEEEQEEDDEDEDPEVKRKEELRARMAKMSGGMGFHGMFGAPPIPSAAPKKKAAKSERPPVHDEEEEEDAYETPISRAAPPIPTPMAMPGMISNARKSEDASRQVDEEPRRVSRAVPPPPAPLKTVDVEEYEDEEDDATTPAPTLESLASPHSITGPPPPLPGGRPAPPPVPAESRPPPPPPHANLTSQTEGSQSDDEMSGGNRDTASISDAPSVPIPSQRLPPIGLPTRSPPLSPRGGDSSATSPIATNKRNSRAPPPIPGVAPIAPPSSSRPPPPPPPGGLSRQSTADFTAPPLPPSRVPQAGDEEHEELTEYEGDYDTDIASSVPHKDALKAHARESSIDENSLQSPTGPPSSPPPIPTASAPRAAPPPLPSQPPPENKRRSVDVPRAAPPPPPPAKEPLATQEEEIDSYDFAAPPSASGTIPSSYSQQTPKIEEDTYFSGPSSPLERRGPAITPGGRGTQKQSLDVQRTSTSNRRSADLLRPSMESGFIANEIDLAVQSGWWKQNNQVPPVLQGRRDIFYECEETTSTNQGAKTVISRDVIVLFQDYSQTILSMQYDPYDPTDVKISQRHEPPPRALRQDQMEEFYERFGRRIADAASSKKDSIVSDGTPQGLVLELLRPFKDALWPVGTRSYGALVYANMANASTQQHDVIRAGDILTVRNGKFQGKHGPMHAKYSADVGKPDHVAIVAEWDGTKKKVRAWEQGRESKKVKMESFKLDDLRSGEVKIWRVVPRSWVGWNSQP